MGTQNPFNFFDHKWVKIYIKEDLKKTFRQVADECGFSEKCLAVYLNGKQIPPLYRLVHLADVLGLTVDECLLDVEDEWEKEE